MQAGLRKVPHVGIVRIGKHVEIGANTTIDRSEFGETVVGDGVKIDNCVHIAHNVKIGPGSAILAHTGVAGSVEIGTGCQIGGQVAIKDHIKIGDGAKIVSKSAVMRDVAPKAVVCGIPSMPFSQWKRVMVVLARLPEYVKAFKKKKKPWWRL
jgi:UDP-3-O-[3-hydroxymyristoyl] glucosamine N-acyltransferase